VSVDGSVTANTGTNAGANNVVGDVNVEAKLSKEGKLRARYFYNSNNSAIPEVDNSKQGVGFVYKTEFDNLKELRVRNRLVKTRKKLTKLLEKKKEEEKVPVLSNPTPNP
jgi:hypothetical protein